jgi:hypothetical protein
MRVLHPNLTVRSIVRRNRRRGCSSLPLVSQHVRDSRRALVSRIAKGDRLGTALSRVVVKTGIRELCTCAIVAVVQHRDGSV